MNNLYLNTIKESGFPNEANFTIYGPQNGCEVPCFFNGINNLNLFVGENNSGKSRFMRGIMQQQKHIQSRSPDVCNKIKELIRLCEQILDKVNNNQGANFVVGIHIDNTVGDDNITSVLNKLPYKGFLANSTSIRLNDQYSPIIKEIETLSETIFHFENGNNLRSKLSLGEDDNEIIGKLTSNIILIYFIASSCLAVGEGKPYSVYGQTNEINKTIKLLAYEIALAKIEAITPNLIYIPILRSARNIFNKKITKKGEIIEKLTDIYINTVASDYHIDISKISIETGLDLYKKIKRTRNQIRDIRKGFEFFEGFLSKNFFGGKDIEIVAKDADSLNEEHISVLIDDSERDIHLLGDGIQSLIILLYPVFMSKEGSYIFIEEPELNMHPGMQRVFVNTLLSNEYIKSKKLTIFITTHSNHLLNTSFDFKNQISIFLFKKEKRVDKLIHTISSSHTKDISILNSLGVTNSSVFLSNCSIWVEGVTDRKYLRKYLEVFINKYFSQNFIREDVHYCFLEYAGSNLSHYIFSEQSEEAELDVIKSIRGLSISNRILLIADLDKGKDKKHSTFREQTSAVFGYYPLPVLEVENLLSAAIIKKVLPELLGISDVEAESVIIEDVELQKTGIGRYLKTRLDEASIITAESFASPSGTIGTYYKNRLADIAVKYVTWDSMTFNAKTLAHHIFDFIINHNRGGAVDYDFTYSDILKDMY